MSTDGVTFTQVVDSAFGTIADPDTNGHYFDVPAAVGVTDVNFVKFWIDSPQVPDFATNCPDGPFGGCTFVDMTELEVFGTLAGP